MLKPQDVVVLCKLVTQGDPQVPIHRLASALHMSPSEVHHAIHRAVDAGLLSIVEHRTKAHEKIVNRPALLELAVTGLKYFFPVLLQSQACGIPTSWAAPMLLGPPMLDASLPPVWPTPDGPVRGFAVEPLYRCVPKVAARDPQFYALMASMDAIRTRCERTTPAATTTLTALLLNEIQPPRLTSQPAPMPGPRTSECRVG